MALAKRIKMNKKRNALVTATTSSYNNNGASLIQMRGCAGFACTNTLDKKR